jgi:hypothetical protein
MSIGITYTLQDRILIIADTRQIEGYSTENESIINDTDKIYDISHQIAAIGVGIRQGIEIAANTLKVSVDENSTLDRISDALAASIEVGWKGLKQIVTADVNINAPYFKLGLLIGGVAEDQLFTMGVVRSYKSKPKVIKTIGSHMVNMIGIESMDIPNKFAANIEEIINHHNYSKDKNDTELLSEKILLLAENTIKETAKKNNMISSNITHTIIWK